MKIIAKREEEVKVKARQEKGGDKMKTLFITALILLTTSVTYAGQIRQQPFPDLSGHPVYVYTDDNGDQSTIKQNPFPDISGNPVVRMEGDAGSATFRYEPFPDLSGHAVIDVDDN